jgi:hypothetical protein
MHFESAIGELFPEGVVPEPVGVEPELAQAAIVTTQLRLATASTTLRWWRGVLRVLVTRMSRIFQPTMHDPV